METLLKTPSEVTVKDLTEDLVKRYKTLFYIYDWLDTNKDGFGEYYFMNDSKFYHINSFNRGKILMKNIKKNAVGKSIEQMLKDIETYSVMNVIAY